MAAINTQVSTFLDNIAISSTARSARTGAVLVPVNEYPPKMWAVEAMWQPFVGTEILTKSGTVRVSTHAKTGDKKLTHIRTALSSLLVLIAAKTPEHSTGTPISAKDTGKWCNVIVTWARLIFRAPLEQIGRGATEFNISALEARSLIDWYDEVHETTLQLAGCQSCVQLLKTGQALCKTFSFPTLCEFEVKDLIAIKNRDHAKEEPAYYAMVVYMSGRSLTNKTHNAVTNTRPKNLQQKFNEGATWESISGQVVMSKGAYSHIAKAWQMNTTMRISLLVPLISLDSGDSYMTGNIVYTTFKLLRGAGMAHVGIIAAFLRKYPYAAELPEIRSEVYYLALHSQSLRSSPTHIQPYYKLLYADAAGLFDSKTLARLTGLAVTILARDVATLSDYAHQDDPLLIQAFDELRADKEDDL